jgi:hypothetical protein
MIPSFDFVDEVLDCYVDLNWDSYTGCVSFANGYTIVVYILVFPFSWEGADF